MGGFYTILPWMDSVKVSNDIETTGGLAAGFSVTRTTFCQST